MKHIIAVMLINLFFLQPSCWSLDAHEESNLSTPIINSASLHSSGSGGYTTDLDTPRKERRKSSPRENATNGRPGEWAEEQRPRANSASSVVTPLSDQSPDEPDASSQKERSPQRVYPLQSSELQ